MFSGGIEMGNMKWVNAIIPISFFYIIVTTKNLAKLLLPLRKNQNTINSTKSFMSFIKY